MPVKIRAISDFLWSLFPFFHKNQKWLIPVIITLSGFKRSPWPQDFTNDITLICSLLLKRMLYTPGSS